MREFTVDVYQKERFVVTVKAHNAIEAEALVNEMLTNSGTPEVTDEAWDATAEHYDVHPDGLGDVGTFWEFVADETGDIELSTGKVEDV